MRFTKRQYFSDVWFSVKFWSLRLFFVFIFGSLLANIFFLQVKKESLFSSFVHVRADDGGSSYIKRGLIYFTDKNNNLIPAVLNKDYPIIFAVPKEVKDPSYVAKMLAPIVNKDQEFLEKILSKPNDLFELILEKANDYQVSQIRALNLEGIYIRSQNFRFYPYGNLAAHLLGFLAPAEDGTVKGRYGLELEFEKKLSGLSKESELGKEGIKEGESIVTTIDHAIQAEAEKIVSSLVKEWRADEGLAIVQDPWSGKILAMGIYPSFDPNNYSSYKIENFINPAVQLLYEPGSVFKPITMAAGIDSGKITPQTTYYDAGYVKVDDRIIRNWDNKSHGLQTMTNVIEKSLNTGSVFAERTMGHSIFAQYLRNFGFGEKTGIQLPGEISGNIRNLNSKKDVDFATISYGQGISVTPIALINAFSAIANGGVLMKPLILADEKPQVIRRVIKPETAKQVTEMMVSAVDVNKIAHFENYKVAGKTGTAFIPDFKKGGYTDKVINTYIGFAPASQPKFVILIRLTNPAGSPLAGQTVVPAFRKLTEFLLNYYGVAPDRITENTLD